ncbi:hypothetical protein ACFW2Y_30855, partial [Streptomyces sp. NPDC058877]|uniref:hypothetical protein n=1 Tax=Streptomyces sp. NPDC058877 TaxID=3346665 RepID=UPI003688E3E2
MNTKSMVLKPITITSLPVIVTSSSSPADAVFRHTRRRPLTRPGRAEAAAARPVAASPLWLRQVGPVRGDLSPGGFAAAE